MDRTFSFLDASSPRSSTRASVYSRADSTRPMLADYNNDSNRDSQLRNSYLRHSSFVSINGTDAHPSPPSTAPPSTTHLLPRAASSSPNGTSTPPSGAQTPVSPSAVSLSVNYLPSKFSSRLMLRKPASRAGVNVQGAAPKPGGGLAAFKSGEARMGGRTLRWTRFKWILLIANILLTLYSLGGLITCLLVWFNVFPQSEVVTLGNRTELILSTLASALGVLTSTLGWAGLLLNNRAFLSYYTLLTWIVFILLLTPGYLTFRRRQYNLEGKVNAQWSRALDPTARMRIQSNLACCGYFSPYVEATVSQTCYSRSILPGCKLPYLEYQRDILTIFWKVVFSVVPAHLLVMIAALMCSNHVTYRFGKGMMPARYRLDADSMAVIMDQYAGQLAQQYGQEVAEKVMARTKSSMSLLSDTTRRS